MTTDHPNTAEREQMRLNEAEEYVSDRLDGDETVTVMVIGRDVVRAADLFRLGPEKDHEDDDEPDATKGSHGTKVATFAAAMAGRVGDNDEPSGIRLGVSQFTEKAPAQPDEALEEAFRWAADNGDIIVHSWSWSYNEYLHNGVRYAKEQGVPVFAAAGNDTTDDPKWAYPALFPSVVGVGATDGHGKRTSYTNYGDVVDVSAPGGTFEDKLRAYQSDSLDGEEDNPDKRWEYTQTLGTSMATPYVGRVAALMMLVNPKLKGNGKVVEEIIEATATDIDTTVDMGRGRVDALAAVQAADDLVNFGDDFESDYFEVYRRDDGDYGWRFYDENGEIAAISGEGFTTRETCLDSIASVKRNALGAPYSEAEFEWFRDANDRPRWRLRHENGNIIATVARGYEKRYEAEFDMNDFRHNSLRAVVKTEESV